MKMDSARLFLLGFLIAIATTLNAQEQAPTLEKMLLFRGNGVNSNGIAAQFVSHTATDANGNVYIAGGFYALRMRIGDFVLKNTGDSDAFLVKLNANLEPVWAKSGGGALAQWVSGLAVDANGNCHVAIESQPKLSFDGVSLSTGSNAVAMIVKYSRSGQMLWHHKVSGVTGSAWRNALAVDTRTNVFYGGQFSDNSFVLRKLDRNGARLWTSTTGPVARYDEGLCLAADNNGNCVVVGSFVRKTYIGSMSLTSRGSRDLFVAKFSSSGPVMWAHSAGGSNIDEASDVAVDTEGNIYVLGRAHSSTATFGGQTITNDIGPMFIARYRPNGAVRWVRRISEKGYPNIPLRISVDEAGKVYVAATVGASGENLESPSFIAKFNTVGDEVWRKRMKMYDIGLMDTQPFRPTSRVAFDNKNNLYLSGKLFFSEGYCELDGFTFYPEHSGDFVFKFSPVD